MILEIGLGVVLVVFFLSGIRIVEQTERGLIENWGRYSRFAGPGFNWIFPVYQTMRQINITEMMVDAQSQEIITKDKLNARVDAQVYFKVKDEEKSVMASQYNVDKYKLQIVSLARTTLRNIIGNMDLKDANSDRNKINKSLMEILMKETKNWGIEIVRTELKEIEPPKEVQSTMNSIVMAENKKTAASDLATAMETEADGLRRAKIKEAEGIKQYAILEAQGKAQAFHLVNQSFKGNAQLLRKLEVTENSLKNNSKIILPEGKSLINVIGSLSEAMGKSERPSRIGGG